MFHFEYALSVLTQALIFLSGAFYVSLGKKLTKLDMVDSVFAAVGLVTGVIGIGFSFESLGRGWDVRYTIKHFQLTISGRESLAIILLSLFYLCCGFLAGWIRENGKRQEDGKDKITYRDFISRHKLFFINLHTIIGIVLLVVYIYLQKYAIIQTF
ncbi:hypothetical protein [Thermotomaculum hydrothermale]|nr:hypothetical protein [Thermotomaculum hydrothermale]